MLSVEAVRKAQEKYGEGKAMTGEQVRWGLENLDISDARLKEIGATNLLPEIKTSCDNHEGSGKVKISNGTARNGLWFPTGSKATRP